MTDPVQLHTSLAKYVGTLLDHYRVVMVGGASEVDNVLQTPFGAAVPLSHFVDQLDLPASGGMLTNALEAGFYNDGAHATENQAAWQAACTSGAGLAFPEGTYDLTGFGGSTKIDGDLVIRGVPGKTVFKTHNSQPLFNAGSANIDVEGVVFEGTTPTSNAVFQFDEMTSDINLVRIHGCEFRSQKCGIRTNTNVSHNFFVKMFRITKNWWHTPYGAESSFVRLGSGCRIARAHVDYNLVDGATRAGIVVGFIKNDGTGRLPDDLRYVQVCRNRVKDIQPPSDPGSEGTYGIQVQAKDALIFGNDVSNVYPGYGSASVSNIEPIYVKSENCIIAYNHVTNCGGNQAYIGVKGVGGLTQVRQPGTLVFGNQLIHENQTGVFSAATAIWIQGHRTICQGNRFKGFNSRIYRINPVASYRQIMLLDSLIEDHYGERIVQAGGDVSGVFVDGLVVDGWHYSGSTAVVFVAEGASPNNAVYSINNVTIMDYTTTALVIDAIARFTITGGPVDVNLTNIKTQLACGAMVIKGGAGTGRANVQISDRKNCAAVFELTSGGTDWSEKYGEHVGNTNYGVLT